jgi:hypothetical protein
MKWNNTLLDAQRLVCDPPADEVVSRLTADFGPDKAREVFGMLIRNIDMPFEVMPHYVREFFDREGASPPGIDQARVVRGQKVFVDLGPEIALMLYFKSLPTTYLNWRLCETLAITGRLDDTRKWPEVFSRRVGETTQFLLDVMTPGSLRPGGKGIATTLKVRLVHASIRHFVGASPKYKEVEWQKPINQEDLAYTLLTFGLAMVMGLEKMKVKLSTQQAEDFYYAWTVVGMHLGIRPEMIPTDLSDARAQGAAMLNRLVKPTENAQSITKALLDFARQSMLPTDLLDNSPEFLLRYFMGDAHAAVLGVKPRKGFLAALFPKAIAAYFGWLEKLEDKGLGVEKLSNKLGMAVIRGMMRHFQSVKGRALVVPEDLAKSWGL